MNQDPKLWATSLYDVIILINLGGGNSANHESKILTHFSHETEIRIKSYYNMEGKKIKNKSSPVGKKSTYRNCASALTHCS